MGQDPGNAEEHETCVRTKFISNADGSLAILEKVEVNGPGTHPVWQWLRLASNGGVAPIPWNFTMFLVDPDGNGAKRFEASKPPSAIRDDIEAALKAVTAPS